MFGLPQSWNTYGSVGIASGFALEYYGTCIVFQNMALFWICSFYDSRDSSIWMYTFNLYCWSLLVLWNTVHVFIIHLQCYCHMIVVGLHIKVRIRVLYNSLDFRARHSCANRLLCSTFLFACLRCILHVGLWCGAICGTCLVVCATEFFLFDVQFVLN